ncbi:TetR/AcrR family transcriptional regulator [Nonomuraea ceibae]|uniref:TetR/AcrR family transcriptional regulator n=1 Tax=Nonomuraea ceibae TaxID=1935170 RepID=UPI0027E008E9|nr:TetR/AcrR family transcriptional regulator [Nonomuraea ceibae]
MLQATQDELVERGFHGLNMEQVATRAGIGKTTIYRRWGTTAGLVTELMTELAAQSSPPPDTGSIQGDLEANAISVMEAVNDPRLGATFQAVIAAATCDEGAAAALRAFYGRRISEWATVADQAIARGDLPPGTDGQELIKAVSAPLYYRLVVTREPVDREAAVRAVTVALIAARAGAFVTGPAAAGVGADPGVPGLGVEPAVPGVSTGPAATGATATRTTR